MKTMKVGQWFSKLDDNQKEVFKRLISSETKGVNVFRKFLSSAKKQFGNEIEYMKGHKVKFQGKIFYYSYDWDKWSELNG